MYKRPSSKEFFLNDCDYTSGSEKDESNSGKKSGAAVDENGDKVTQEPSTSTSMLDQTLVAAIESQTKKWIFEEQENQEDQILINVLHVYLYVTCIYRW